MMEKYLDLAFLKKMQNQDFWEIISHQQQQQMKV
jgi:hypothetical protein